MTASQMESMLYRIEGDQTYAEKSIVDFNVFNAEYRILQAKWLMDSVASAVEEHRYCSLMKRLLASANGGSAYDIELELLFQTIKDKEAVPPEPGEAIVPMTFIAYKSVSKQIYCSIEKLLIGSKPGTAEGICAGRNLYMSNAVQKLRKLREANYNAVGVIGKGDFTEPLKRVFAEKFNYQVM
ncbi:hypothetical protein [Paenibacillus radicis (ex Gao et al. 2016)]|uniref:Uncharacterized protein n=1 Tax=Paenibacillus radicis (ex Gao et al. 2016) TaxID=1737354 RepID=A0A917H5L4_9BACL|nr:hypothetical protein [Paenibacillus radicis (ex Gao et al. 2016)]GGG67865.1 hypothetical protein GCM10010918_23250 [Paenibacillus radicis (ex Gao et al. 2016)]